MPCYRRTDASGGAFFFTVVSFHRRPLFDQPVSRQLLHEAVRKVRYCYPFIVDAWVLLPEHMHCIWTLPKGNADYSLRWNLIKSSFSKRAKHLYHVEAWMNDSKLKHRESTIWQRRFWEHHIRSDDEYEAYMDYIHYNPVKHGLVRCVRDWPHSTFHRYVKLGIYPDFWGVGIERMSDLPFGD